MKLFHRCETGKIDWWNTKVWQFSDKWLLERKPRWLKPGILYCSDQPNCPTQPLKTYVSLCHVDRIQPFISLLYNFTSKRNLRFFFTGTKLVPPKEQESPCRQPKRCNFMAFMYLTLKKNSAVVNFLFCFEKRCQSAFSTSFKTTQPVVQFMLG